MKNPSGKSLQHKRAAHSMHAKYGRGATRKARSAFLSKFEREVDPDGVLPPAERQERAEHARRAHMLMLAERSVEARRARKAGVEPRQEAS